MMGLLMDLAQPLSTAPSFRLIPELENTVMAGISEISTSRPLNHSLKHCKTHVALQSLQRPRAMQTLISD
jgi:hypothetical protein